MRFLCWGVGLLMLSAGCTEDKGGGPKQVAESFMADLQAGEWAQAAARYDEKMAQAMPPAQLQKAFETVTQKHGGIVKVSPPSMTLQDKNWVAEYEVEYADAIGGIRVVLDGQSRVSGLWFDAARNKDGSVPPPVEAPQTGPRQVALETGAEGWPLPGKLTLPDGDGPFACVVLVHGSGPHDMDETIGPNKPFWDLAKGLAARGIATYRYDKRTKAHAQKLAAKLDFTVDDETVADAAAAVRTCASDERVAKDKVFVLGHSLGGMLIPRIAQAAPDARGFVILAGTTRPLAEVIVEQVSYVASLKDSPLTPAQKAELIAQADEVKALTPADKAGAEPGKLPFGIPASYWLDLRGYDPAEAIKAVDKPVFALQGGRDYQVTDEDFKRWQAALAKKKGAMFKRYENLNHLFAEGQGKSTPAEYEQPTSISTVVLDDIAAFVKRAAR